MNTFLDECLAEEKQQRIKQFREDDERIHKLVDAWKKDELDKSQLEKSKQQTKGAM